MTTQHIRTGRDGALVLLGAMLGARYPDLIPAARARGLAVLGIDASTPRARRFDQARREVPGHPLAALAELEWIGGDQHEEVIQQVLDWHAVYGIRGVLAYGEDYVEVAALIADLLGLPGPGLRAARVCRNKLLQRRYLQEYGPVSELVGPANRAEVPRRWSAYPAVVKPLDGTASSGVERVDEAGQLAEALAARPPDVPLLVEELVQGHELSVESVVHRGEVLFACPTGKRTNERRGRDTKARFFVELGHTVPDCELSDAARAAVLQTNGEVLRRLDFRDGIAHAEYRIAADGHPRLMEIAARPAGDNILTLYHLATGRPIEEALLAVVLGEKAAYPQPRRYARQVYPEHHPGVLRDVTAPGLGTEIAWLTEGWMWPEVKPLADGPPTDRMIVVGRAVGDELSQIRSSSDRAAMYVIDASAADGLDTLQAQVDAVLTIHVEAGDRGVAYGDGNREEQAVPT